MKPISRVRFDALAAYARDPRTILAAEELAYFEHADERVLGMLIRDRTDQDYAGIVMARDELLQYRWTAMTEFEVKERWARAHLRPALEQAAMAPDEQHTRAMPKPSKWISSPRSWTAISSIRIFASSLARKAFRRRAVSSSRCCAGMKMSMAISSNSFNHSVQCAPVGTLPLRHAG